jgi:SAM-dependent methyltransferase
VQQARGGSADTGGRPGDDHRPADQVNEIGHGPTYTRSASLVFWQHGQVNTSGDVNYRHDLAAVHHRGFGAHAAACAPGIVDLLAPVRARNGLILELGCGTGLLTTELIAAGHRVIATDASLAMLEVARGLVGESAEEVRQLTLPDDPLPRADAIVAVGHPLSYLPDADAVSRALVAIAEALRPGGLLAMDLCDLEWGRARRDTPNFARSGADWAIITEFSVPAPDRFVRDITTFVPNPDGSWRRDTEHHENVLVDTAQIPALLSQHGVQATVGSSFGTETLPPGLRVITGHKP